MNREKKYLKGIINEVFAEYHNKGGFNSGPRNIGVPKTKGDKKKKKFQEIEVKKIKSQKADGTIGDFAYFIIKNITKEDAFKIRERFKTGRVESRPVTFEDKKTKKTISYTTYDFKIAIPLTMANDWVESQFPTIIRILSNSEVADYQNLDEFLQNTLDALVDAPTEEELKRAELSIEKLKERIFNAINAGKFEDAMKMYDYSIELRARVYGHQLSPGNARDIQAQALEHGISPNDKGPDKYWPTFCRSRITWKKWGRVPVPNPKMKYRITTVYGANKVDAQTGAERFGWKGSDVGKLGNQIKDLVTMGHGGKFGTGVVYDISDTIPDPKLSKKQDPNNPLSAPIDTFAQEIGLINNITGILNEPALAKEKELLALDEKNKADILANADAEKMKQLKQIQDDEGKAEVFLEALAKTESGSNPSITMVDTSKSPLDNYINSLIKVSESRIRQQKWSNDVDIHLMAVMMAAAVASQTVGAERIKKLHPDFSAARFKDLGQFNTTLWPLMYGMINRLNNAVDDIYKSKNMATDAAQQITENFFNMLNRMNKVNEEFEPIMYQEGNCEEGEMDESMLPENQGMEQKVLGFLGQFGFKIGGNEENDIQ